ncbi:hypothetical protein GCM10017322_22640 [Paracoccus aerius]|nr:hypothetical protein GCM10017322_22640 [Paracoccus aerius]
MPAARVPCIPAVKQKLCVLRNARGPQAAGQAHRGGRGRLGVGEVVPVTFLFDRRIGGTTAIWKKRDGAR